MIHSVDTEQVYDKAKGLHKEYIPTIFSKPYSNGDISNAILWKMVQAMRPTRAISTQHDLHPNQPALRGRMVECAMPGKKVYPDRLISPGPLHLISGVQSPNVTGLAHLLYEQSHWQAAAFLMIQFYVRGDVASGRQAHNIKSTLHSAQKPYYFQRDQHNVHFVKTAYLRIFIPSLLYIPKSSLCPAVFAAWGLRSLFVQDITQQWLNFKSWTPCSPWKETSLELSKSTI